MHAKNSQPPISGLFFMGMEFKAVLGLSNLLFTAFELFNLSWVCPLQAAV